MAELYCSHRGLYTVPKEKEKYLGTVLMYCALISEWLWLAIKAVLSEQSDWVSG